IDSEFERIVRCPHSELLPLTLFVVVSEELNGSPERLVVGRPLERLLSAPERLGSRDTAHLGKRVAAVLFDPFLRRASVEHSKLAVRLRPNSFDLTLKNTQAGSANGWIHD